ncbi:MAG TPA: BON domain-containing protein, partial [Candidatus Binatia bacterium]|nr:BON domain-containing protein [Candidatus Binatia bacterium]
PGTLPRQGDARSRNGRREIRDRVCRVLLEEPPLEHCIIHGIVGDGVPTGQETSQRGRSIVVAVSSGLVTLNGEVLSRKHKRRAGVLAWWVPGTRDVVNGLEEVPAE